MEAAMNLPDDDGQDQGRSEEDQDALLRAVGAGTYDVVRIEDLHIDEHYQRDLSRDLVEKIKREWKDAAAGAIVVSRRKNDDLYIVNGQHRTAAASELGKTEILAQVIDGLDRQMEAKLRLWGNTRRTDTAQERFRAQVAAGDVESIAIQQIANQFNTRINPSPDTKNGINTVSAVEDLYRTDGRGIMLTSVLEVIQDAFGHIGGKAAGVAMMKGVAWFLLKHRQEIDPRRFRERLGTETPDGIDRRARNHKAASGGAMWMNYYRAMVEIYNVRLAESQRLEIKTGGWSAGAFGETRDGW
jgi:hypothetical protein